MPQEGRADHAHCANWNLDYQLILVTLLQRNWMGLRTARSGKFSNLPRGYQRGGLDCWKKLSCSRVLLVVADLALRESNEHGTCFAALGSDGDYWFADAYRWVAFKNNRPRPM